MQAGAEFDVEETNTVDREYSKTHDEYRLKVYNCLWVTVPDVVNDKKLQPFQPCSCQCSGKPPGMRESYRETINI